MQSILWCPCPPPGRSSTLKIACGSNIDDIRGNTTLVSNCLYLQKIQLQSFHCNFVLRVVSNSSALLQKNFIKIGHRTQKICSFQRTSPIFCVLASTVKWIAQPDVDGHLLFYMSRRTILKRPMHVKRLMTLMSSISWAKALRRLTLWNKLILGMALCRG